MVSSSQATLAHERHGQQFAVTAYGLRAGPLKERCDFLHYVIHDYKHPRAEGKLDIIGSSPCVFTQRTKPIDAGGFPVNYAELA